VCVEFASWLTLLVRVIIEGISGESEVLPKAP